MPKLDAFLQLGRKEGCSDVHVAPGHPPLLRLYGRLNPVRFRTLEDTEIRTLISEITSPEQEQALAEYRDVDFTYASDDHGRYRVHIFHKIGGLAATFRVIPDRVPSLESLRLPPAIAQLAAERDGLVLVTGAAGTGKTTTLAAMIDHINRQRKVNIITLEDPIEYLHASRLSQVIQRGVGEHLTSFADGLRAALREDPDVIMVGEMRDLETISLALTAAETGHLVFGTLHTTSAVKTLDRVVDAVPAEQKAQTAVLLSQHLRGVVSQRLLRTSDGNGRRAVCEILLNTPAIASLIQNRKNFLIADQLQIGRQLGMQLMDQGLRAALATGEIDPNEAYLCAEDKKAFRRHVTDTSILPRMSVVGR